MDTEYNLTIGDIYFLTAAELDFELRLRKGHERGNVLQKRTYLRTLINNEKKGNKDRIVSHVRTEEEYSLVCDKIAELKLAAEKTDVTTSSEDIHRIRLKIEHYRHRINLWENVTENDQEEERKVLLDSLIEIENMIVDFAEEKEEFDRSMTEFNSNMNQVRNSRRSSIISDKMHVPINTNIPGYSGNNNNQFEIDQDNRVSEQINDLSLNQVQGENNHLAVRSCEQNLPVETQRFNFPDQVQSSSKYVNKNYSKEQISNNKFNQKNSTNKNLNEFQNRSNNNFNKNLHIHRWNFKFNGDNDSLYLFIDQLKSQIAIENLDKEQVYSVLFALFEGKAKIWYQSNRKEFISWDNFENRLLEDFQDHKSELALSVQIKTYKQKESEDVLTYISYFKVLLQRLNKPMDIEDQIEIIIKGALEKYRIPLRMGKYQSLNEVQKTMLILEQSFDVKNSNINKNNSNKSNEKKIVQNVNNNNNNRNNYQNDNLQYQNRNNYNFNKNFSQPFRYNNYNNNSNYNNREKFPQGNDNNNSQNKVGYPALNRMGNCNNDNNNQDYNFSSKNGEDLNKLISPNRLENNQLIQTTSDAKFQEVSKNS